MAVQKKLEYSSNEKQIKINEVLDRVNLRIQKQQRAAGKTFVSRTRFSQPKYGGEPVSVFRVVMANPMTTMDTIRSILDEQVELACDDRIQTLLADIA